MEEKYILHNYMLDLMAATIPVYIQEYSEEIGEYAKSSEFIQRLKVAALNKLPSRYVTSSAGAVYSAFSMKKPQHNVDLMSALISASAEVIAQMNGDDNRSC